MSKFGEVPSNTRTNRLVAYFQSSRTFLELLADPSLGACGAWQYMLDYPPNECCAFGYTAQVLEHITRGLLGTVPHHRSVVSACRQVTADSLNEVSIIDQGWHLTLADHSTISTARVMFATGCTPATQNYHVTADQSEHSTDQSRDLAVIPLESTFHAIELTRVIQPHTRVAVIGSSHSALLALMNIVRLIEQGLYQGEVWLVHRSPLKFMTPLPNGDALHFYDGLKGPVGDWARDQLLPGKCPRTRVVSLADDTCQTWHRTLQHVTGIIYAVGYDRTPLPPIWCHVPDVHERALVDDAQLRHDADTYQLLHPRVALPGLFGLGVAFPARHVDSTGHVQAAIGLPNFMNAAIANYRLWLGSESRDGAVIASAAQSNE